MSQFLAAIGALAGVAGVAWAVWTWRSSGPKVVLEATAFDDGHLLVTVRNIGRAAVGVDNVLVYQYRGQLGFRPREPAPSLPQLLQPQTALNFHYDLVRLPEPRPDPAQDVPAEFRPLSALLSEIPVTAVHLGSGERVTTRFEGSNRLWAAWGVARRPPTSQI